MKMTSFLEEEPHQNTLNKPLPVWIRLPKSGTREYYSNLSRSALNALILPCAGNGYKPPVASKSLLMSKHARRGCRMINLQSLIAYLRQPQEKGGSHE